MKNDKKFDERAYSLLKPNLPNYLNKVITSFGKMSLNYASQLPSLEEESRLIEIMILLFHSLSYSYKTNQKATMNDIHVPADGYVWFINSGKNHWVKNEGSQPRIHLMIVMDSQEKLVVTGWKFITDTSKHLRDEISYLSNLAQTDKQNKISDNYGRIKHDIACTIGYFDNHPKTMSFVYDRVEYNGMLRILSRFYYVED